MNGIIDNVIDAAEEVHSILGSGFSEAVYHRSLERELSERGISFSSEGSVPVIYKSSPVGTRRPDMFVSDEDTQVIVELKAGSSRGEQQIRSYLSLIGDDDNYDIQRGVLLKFNDELEVVRS